MTPLPPQAPTPTSLQHRRLAAMVDMPRIHLPEGVVAVEVTAWDTEAAGIAASWDGERAVREARLFLRRARRAQRRAGGRPAAKRRKAIADAIQARDLLRCAGVACAVAELLRHRMTPTAERIARARERCDERFDEEPGRYAVDVENWIRDLAGESRLTRG